MKKLILLTLGLPLLATANQAPTTLAEIQAQITNQMRTGLNAQNLRQSGAYNPFKVMKASGLVEVDSIQELWSGDGGGQNGAFASIDKKAKKMNIRYSNTWVHQYSKIYCMPSAVEKVSKSPTYSYNTMKEEMANQCLEIAVVSDDLSLDSFINFGVSEEDNGPLSFNDLFPEYDVDLSVKDGKLNLELLSGGRYNERIYILNEGDLMNHDYRYNVIDRIEENKLTPSVQVDQGLVSNRQLIRSFKNVEWLAYQVPSTRTDITKARAALDLLPAGYQRETAENILGEIGKYQSLRAAQNSEAEKAQLFGSQELRNKVAQCKDIFRKNKKLSHQEFMNQCGDTLKADRKITQARYADSTYKRYTNELGNIFPAVKVRLDGLIEAIDRDPSIINFLIEIQP